MGKQYNIVTIDQFVADHDGAIDAIAKQALTDMLADIKVVPGRMRGGDAAEGEIPRDTGALAASLTSSVVGGGTTTGKESYISAIAGARADKTLSFMWGSGKAHYAQKIHDGFGNFPGTRWVLVATAKWGDYVRKATARVKAGLR